MQEQPISQQREKALYRYSTALEQGDIDGVIMVLQQAEHDHLLEQMIVDMHEEVYQHEDTPLIYDHDTAHTTPLVRSKPLPKHSIHETPRSRQVVSALQSLVAVLVVGVLIGGFLLLFSARHNSGSTGAQPQKQATLPCIFNQGPMNDPGLNQVCKDHLYQDIHITKTIGIFKLETFQAYADANQVVIAYKFYDTRKLAVHKNLNPSLLGTLNASPGITINPSGAIISMNIQDVYIQVWNVNNISKDPQKITLHWDLNDIHLAEYKGPNQYNDRDVKTSTHFNFTIPFYNGHTIQVNQTRSINGKTLHADQVMVTPSAVRVSFKKGYGIKEIHDFEVSLSNYDSAKGYGYKLEANSIGDMCTYILNVPLFKHRGPVTITIYPEFRKPNIQWSFTINMS